MANVKVKNADSGDIFFKASGAGSDGDPNIVEHLETNSAAIKTAVELIDNAISGSEMQVDVVTVAIPGTFYMGQTNVTTAGTEVALGSSQALLSGVTVKAKHANTGWIYVGTNPVTSATGFVLDAGEQIFVETDNVADVYIDSSVNGEGVSYIGS